MPGSEELPYDIDDVDKESNEELLRDMTGERTGWLRVGPKGYCLPSQFGRDAPHFYNFAVRESDTWVVTFPRSGTTLTQEMVWIIANNFDFKTAAKIPLVERFPFLEYHLFMHEETKEMFKQENGDDKAKHDLIDKLATPAFQTLLTAPSPRFIKTHLPPSLLPKDILKAKVIYVARNPKEVCVSYFHLLRLMRTSGYIGNFEKFWEYFERALLPWAPFYDHILEGWKIKDHPNVLFLFYENMIKDIPACIKQVAAFLGKEVTEDNLKALSSHLDINNFRNNSSVNFDILKQLGIQAEGEQTFVRKGQTGIRSSEFTPELNTRADKWVEENSKRTNFKFPEVRKREIKEGKDEILNNNTTIAVKN